MHLCGTPGQGPRLARGLMEFEDEFAPITRVLREQRARRLTTHGDWWPPASPGEAVRGTLSFDSSLNALLDLEYPFSSHDYPVIHGRDWGHGEFTLFGCRALPEGPSESGRIRWSVDLVLLGSLLPSLGEATYHSFGVSLTNLGWWTSRDTFPFRIQYRPSAKYVAFQPPRRLRLLREPIQIDILFLAAQRQSANLVLLEHAPFLELRFSEAVGIRDASVQFECLKRFLSFITQSAVSVDEVTAVHNDRTRRDVHLDDRPVPDQYVVPSVELPISSSLHEPLISFFEERRSIPGMLSRWLGIEKKCPALVHSMTVWHSAAGEIERFTSMFQAIESWHNTYRRNYEVRPSVHKARVKRVLERLPKHDQAWARGKLDNNRISLLASIQAGMRLAMDLLGCNEVAVEIVARAALDWRHSLSHPDHRLSRNPALTLEEVTEALYAAVLCILLKQLGVKHETAKRALLRTWVLMRLPKALK